MTKSSETEHCEADTLRTQISVSTVNIIWRNQAITPTTQIVSRTTVHIRWREDGPEQTIVNRRLHHPRRGEAYNPLATSQIGNSAL